MAATVAAVIVKNVAIAIPLGALLAAAPARGQGNIQAIVTHNVQPLLSESGAGGVAVAVRMSGRTEFFNYGFANLARNERVTADSLFNLGSVGKLFAPTLLAEAVKRGELSLDDSVAKYVTELQKGGDILRGDARAACQSYVRIAARAAAIRRLASRKYTWPDFVRFL